MAARPAIPMVYVGDMTPATTSAQRAEALARLGYAVTSISSLPPQRSRRFWLSQQLYWRHLPAPKTDARHGWSRQLLDLCRELQPEILWLDKATCVREDVLRGLKQANPALRIVGYSADDMSQRHNRSVCFDDHAAMYDLYITTKSHAQEAMTALGIRSIALCNNAFDPQQHRPPPLTDADFLQFGADIAFIGTWEAERSAMIDFLARSDLDVRVWGNGWPASNGPVRAKRRPVFGLDYAKTIAASSINLCFLRKLNHDQQTTRSVEIPACGGFMLAERTAEHQALFVEGVEAEFFSTAEELRDKCRYYLANDAARRRIALAGHRRCEASRYDNDATLARALEALSR